MPRSGATHNGSIGSSNSSSSTIHGGDSSRAGINFPDKVAGVLSSSRTSNLIQPTHRGLEAMVLGHCVTCRDTINSHSRSKVGSFGNMFSEKNIWHPKYSFLYI